MLQTTVKRLVLLAGLTLSLPLNPWAAEIIPLDRYRPPARPRITPIPIMPKNLSPTITNKDFPHSIATESRSSSVAPENLLSSVAVDRGNVIEFPPSATPAQSANGNSDNSSLSSDSLMTSVVKDAPHGLVLRAGPDKAAEHLMLVPNGRTVRVHSVSSPWLEVSAQDDSGNWQRGYAWGYYLTRPE